MSVARQGVRFLAVGCGLIVVDWFVFVALSATGSPAAWSNVAGRVAGALAGFWANGSITFRGQGELRALWFVVADADPSQYGTRDCVGEAHESGVCLAG